MRRALLLVGIVSLALLGALQLVPYGRDHTNPPVIAEPAWDSPASRQLAVRACYDCHSNQTVWPWYSNLAPISWIVQKDVMDGRSELNFSEWTDEQDGGDIAEAVADGSMPMRNYTITHPAARLSLIEKRALIQGLEHVTGTEHGSR